mgnify:CR=1 FL=1
MNYLIVLTKCYNVKDFMLFYDYHSLYFDRILVFDNESPVKIPVKSEMVLGFPDQYDLYNNIFKNYPFKTDDLVCFLDDDEYLYTSLDKSRFNDTVYGVLDRYGASILHMPEILISTRVLLSKRQETLPISSRYIRLDKGNTCKCIIRYDKVDYDFKFRNEKIADTIGHIPSINGKKYSVGLSTFPDISYSSYAKVDLEAKIRLYHYHIKSENDWLIKLNRGSAATKIPWYDIDIRKNYAFGGYDTMDNSVYNKIKENLY